MNKNDTFLEKRKNITNSLFAFGGTLLKTGEKVKANASFIKSCFNAGVKPSAKQASKYRQGKGLAFKLRKHPNTKYLLRQVVINKS